MSQQTNQGGENYQVFTGANNTNFFGGTHYHGRPLPSPQGTPNNLKPSGAVTFVGRENALAELAAQLQGSGPLLITALKGMGGIGKSELALRYALANLAAGTYPDGILWIEGRGADLGTQIVEFAQAQLGLTPPDNLDLAGQVAYCWRHWPPLADAPGRVLVIFDDVTDAAALRPYLPPTEDRYRVVLTSRRQLGRAFSTLELDVLDLEPALALLGSLAGAERIDAVRAEAEALVNWLGRLPLALELVGRYLANHPDLDLTTLQSRLEAQTVRARALLKPEDDEYSDMTAKLGVAAAFELSVQGLTEAQGELAYALSLFGNAAMPWVLVLPCLPEKDEEDLEDGRSALVNRSLLKRVDTGLYQMHPLIREFVRLWGPETLAAAQMEALKRRYCGVMVAVAQQIPQSPTREQIGAVAAAAPHLAEAATMWRDWLADKDVTWPFVGLGRFYAGQGLYGAAEPWLTHCVSFARERFGNEHPSVATSFNNLAYLYRAQGGYSKAEPLFQQALALWQKLLGDEHPAVASSFNNLAGLYESQGRYNEAEPLFQQALDLRQKLLGDDHPDVAQSFNNLALLYQAQGRYSEAEPLFQQALALGQNLLGDEHPDVATSFNNLAGLYYAQGRYSEAEPLFQQALALMQKLIGDEHSSVATSFNNLALLYQAQGRYSETEPLYQQALALRQNLLGDEHPDVATSFNNLALLYQAQGRYSEAEPLYQQALALRQNLLGDEHPDVATSFNNLALLYQAQGRYSEAEPLYQQALVLWQNLLGDEHPSVAQGFNNLGVLHFHQGRYADSVTCLERALALRLRLLGPEHPDTQSTQQNLEVVQQKIAQSTRGSGTGSY
jgi:tetratricopeptide (TPR) repeat protein